MEWQASDFEKHTGIGCVVSAKPEYIKLDKAIATAMFRILQEALTNVARHAAATQVRISVKEVKDALDIEIRDNGKGISKIKLTGPNSLGILGIRERVFLLGGSFSIKDLSGKGTAIRVPLHYNRSISTGN
jgi:signal transduction histidine kinase